MDKDREIMTWDEFAPRTLEEYRALDKRNIDELLQMEESGVANSLAGGDPKQIVRDRADLSIYTSDFVSLRNPTLEHEGSCLLVTTKALINTAIGGGDIEPLVKTLLSAFKTLRLTKVGLNSRTVDVREINPDPITGVELRKEIYDLMARRPSSVKSVSDEYDMSLLLSVASAATQNPEEKRAVEYVKVSGGGLAWVETDDWPHLQALVKRGEVIVTSTTEANGRRHADLVTNIDCQRGVVQTKGRGERTIDDLQRAMRPERRPIIEIPPLEIAGPDKEEIRVRAELYGLSWNRNI